MFQVDSASSGEPPTPQDITALGSQADPAAATVISPLPDCTITSQSISTSGTVLPEPDSGYEASPSSTVGNSAFSFDRVNPDIEVTCDDSLTFHMDDEFSQLGSEGEPDNHLEMSRIGCSRCGSLCFCYYTMNSVSTNNSVSRISDERNYRGNELNGGRPSSLPIAIPLNSNFAGYLSLHSPVARSNPITYGHQITEQRSFPLPMSWPSVTVLGARRVRWWNVSRHLWEDIDGSEANRGWQAAPTRDRRRLIDSDASSFSSSEGDGPEDVFDAEDDSLPTLSANSFGLPNVSSAPRQEALPDLLQVQSSQRSRSVSVNLPISRSLADTITYVGRTLRRLSDEFTRQRQAPRSGTSNRRFTIGDFVNYPSSLSGSRFDDSDEDFASVVSGHSSPT